MCSTEQKYQIRNHEFFNCVNVNDAHINLIFYLQLDVFISPANLLTI